MKVAVGFGHGMILGILSCGGQVQVNGELRSKGALRGPAPSLISHTNRQSPLRTLIHLSGPGPGYQNSTCVRLKLQAPLFLGLVVFFFFPAQLHRSQSTCGRVEDVTQAGWWCSETGPNITLETGILEVFQGVHVRPGFPVGPSPSARNISGVQNISQGLQVPS